MYLRFGNFLRRVAVDKVRPDPNGEIRKEEGYIDNANDVETDENTQRFAEEETPVDELAADIGMSNQNKILENKMETLEKEVETLREFKNSIERGNDTEEMNKDREKDKVSSDEKVEESISYKERVVQKRKEKKMKQKAKKEAEKVKAPTTGQNILYNESDEEGWKAGRVVGSWKKNSIYKYWKHLLIEGDIVVEKDFENGVKEWKVKEEEETNDDEDVLRLNPDGVFPVKLVSPNDYDMPEVVAAIEREISKYKSFDAFQEVEDIGQKSIPTRWVVTEQSGSGKDEPYKARLCMRGDLERGKEDIRSDAPTASKEAIKLTLAIAANEGFTVKTGDIKSAYLQGAAMDREIFVKPPKQANVSNKLWLLLQGAYGIVDGGRLFYLKLSEKLLSLGMHRVHSDGAMFTYVKEGKLHGIVTTHSDDLILAGDETFEENITVKLKDMFTFSKFEENKFKYCGCNITVADDGTITLDQNDYIEKLDELFVEKIDESTELSKEEIKLVRGKIGELLWISLMTRPDISFDVNILSSEVANGTIATVKAVNKIVRKAKSSQNILKFNRLGDFSDLSVKVYADASYGNQKDKVRSTAGRVILIGNEKTGRVSLASWKTKKIGRVCRSVKSAETRALEEAVDDGVNIARLISEVYTGRVNLKEPEQIPVHAFTDSKSLWESLHNTRQCEEKLLRNSIASMKELIDLKMMEDVLWVPTSLQLADCMTKSAKNSDWLLRVARTNTLK